MSWSAPVTYGLGDEVAVDRLLDALPARWDGPVGVGVELPPTWTTADDPFVVVDLVATPSAVPPIEEHQTVRLVVFAATTGTAKRLAGVAQSVLLSHPTVKVRYLTGRSTERDPSNGAHVSACSVRMAMRSTAA